MTRIKAGIFSGANTVALGISLMLLSVLMFALNDAMGKWLVASFSVGQVLLVRSIGAFFVLGPVLATRPPSTLIKVDRPSLHFLRIAMTTGDTALFYAAVAYLPLADVVTFYMAGPIYVAAISHFLLGERIGWRRWLAVMAGFAGVVIALQPSAEMLSWPSVFAVSGSLSFALSIVMSRKLRDTSDTTLVTWQTLACLVVGAVLSIGAWSGFSYGQLFALLLLGVVSCSAHLLMTRSLKLAPASLLAPIQYTLLLWAVVLGWLFFDELPEAYTLFGAVIIVTAGLFIFHRGSVKKDVEPVLPSNSSHG